MSYNHDDELMEIDKKLLALLDERIHKVSTMENEINEEVYLQNVISNYNGTYSKACVLKLLRSLFKESDGLTDCGKEKKMLFSREYKKSDSIVNVGELRIGGTDPVNIFGPCAVESYRQTSSVASMLADRGLRIMRGGAFKPRTSPYDFQGLGEKGLEILAQIREQYGIAVVSEITAPEHVELAEPYLDVFQIGARNMQNFELLKAAGRTDMPILLKRGLSATLEEFLCAAEYILAEGNQQVILCERGIRTYEKSTRNTLDISAVPLLKQASHLPVMVDVTHSTGRKEIMLECARGALAAGADGIMAEVHPEPVMALSDNKQQMSFAEFDNFYTNLL